MTEHEVIARVIVQVIEQLIPEVKLQGELMKEAVIRSAASRMRSHDHVATTPPQPGLTPEWSRQGFPPPRYSPFAMPARPVPNMPLLTHPPRLPLPEAPNPSWETMRSMEWTISDQGMKLARAKDDISTLRESAQARHQERNTAERAAALLKTELAQVIRERDAAIDNDRAFIKQIESMRVHKNQIAVELATREQEFSKLRRLYEGTVCELSRARARLTTIQAQFPTPVTESNSDNQ